MPARVRFTAPIICGANIVNEIECVLRGLVTLEGWVGHNLIADGVCSLGNGVYCKLLMATLLGVKFGSFWSLLIQKQYLYQDKHIL